MLEILKDINKYAIWKLSSLTTEVYIWSTKVQRVTTEVQKAQPNSRSKAEVQETKTE